MNLTGAVNVISNEDFENRQASTVSQLLQGLHLDLILISVHKMDSNPERP